MPSTWQRDDGEEEEGDEGAGPLTPLLFSRSLPHLHEKAHSQSIGCWFALLLSRFFCSVPLLWASRCSASRIPSSVSAMNGCNSRSMLDRYIYDYMIKKQMRGTPEIFGREATLTLESGAGGIDVPEGFLYEWWLIFYETFMASQPNNGSFSGSYPTLKANHLPQNPVPLPYQQNPSTFSSTLNPVVVTDDLISQGGAHLMPPGLDSYLKFLV